MGVDGASVAVGVLVAAPADGVIRRVAPLPDLTIVLLHVLPQVEATRVHEPQHLGQHAARGAVTAEAAHQEARVRVQALSHDSGKLPPTVPGLHRTVRQIEARLRHGTQHAVNNGK